MIGLGTLFKKNVSNWDSGSDPVCSSGPGSAETGKREIRPRLYQDICGLCGRTILTGETTDLFTDKDSGRAIVVCPHCRPQALADGFQKVT